MCGENYTIKKNNKKELKVMYMSSHLFKY